MADSDKNILITPNRGATSQPSVVFTGQGNDPITVRVLDGTTGTGLTAGGALSFEGSAGQLFSVVNRLGTGSIFSVNDISGIPSIDVDANGTIEFAPFTGYVAIGLTAPAEKLHVIGNMRLSGGLSAASATFSNDIIVNGVRVGEGGGSISTNVAVGQSALNANTTGSQSVAIGTEAAATGVTVANITAVGYRSLYLNTVDNNTSVGSNSLQANTTGTQNVAVGTSTMFSNTTGSFNVGMGHGALNSQIDSTENIAVGRLTLQNLSSGSQNTAIGSQAGRYFGSGTTSATNISNSILIGYDSRPSANAQSNQIVIGYQGRGDGSNTTVIGNSSTTSTRVFGQLSTNDGVSAAGGTFSSPVRFLSGLCATTQINVNSSATGASPFTITANSLVDGVGAFRINGSEPDINLNDTDGGFNTITFENAGNARAAIGRDSGDAFYIAVRDPAVSGGAWKGDVIVANSSTGNVSMGYQLSVAGGLCASGVTSNSYVLTSSGLKNVNGITYEFLASDNGKILYTTNDYGPGLTLTIPTGLPIGFNCTIIQTGAGQIRFTGPNGLTLNSYGNQFRTIGRHASATITEYQNNVVNLSGNLIV